MYGFPLLDSTQRQIATLLIAATLLPLASSLIAIFLGKPLLKQKTGPMTTGVMLVSFLFTLIAAALWAGTGGKTIVVGIPWIPLPGTEVGHLYLGLLADSLTVALMCMVSFISMLVHLYSIGYMHGDKKNERFFAYMSLFTFSMMGIVTANGLMQLLVFWELVGLTSYLLIGFWHERRAPQLACKKAFIMNRIGDTGFLIGFGILFYKLGAKVMLPAVDGGMFDAIANTVGGAEVIAGDNPPLWLTVAGIALFFGAIGKSAQFPLHTWLPDAMEGPTPVSSIVHSATMVAAGVYLTARIYPILTPGAHLFVATIGLITLVMAACMALVMTDIKRVLAYSTLSQLGYMILALGAGAYAFALFHLITHAFFKCCLFQCAGSVIHAADGQQDMRYYGGLRKKLPITMVTYGICLLAIAGASIPFTAWGMSGFYSKDGIIAGTYNYANSLADSLGGLGWLFFLGPMIVAYVTVFYMARSFALTFLGRPRDQHLYDHAHEAPWTMWLSQAALAFMAIFATLFPFLPAIINSEPKAQGVVISWLQPAQALSAHGPAMNITHLMLLHGVGWILALGLGLYLYKDGMKQAERIARLPMIKQLHTWALNKFYFDALYDNLGVGVVRIVVAISGAFDRFIIDGLVNLAGQVGLLLSKLIGAIDDRIVDGLVNGAANATQTSGDLLRTTQPGNIRKYVMLMFAAATLIMLVVVTVALVVNG